MFGASQRKLEAQAVKALRAIPRHARSERQRTMRWYRRQHMAHALKRARAELAIRKAGPAVFLMLLGAAALGIAIGVGVRILWGAA